MKAAIELRNVLAARRPHALFDLWEAALYTGRSPKTIRNLSTGARAKLRPDGRGAKRSPLFKRATLDAFLAARAGGRS